MIGDEKCSYISKIIIKNYIIDMIQKDSTHFIYPKLYTYVRGTF